MRKLITFLSSIILLIVLVAIFVPFGMGFWVKNQYPTILEKLSQSPQFTLQLISFERGWFQSKAKIRIALKTPTEQKNGKIVLNSTNTAYIMVNETIYHGPVILEKRPDGSSKIVLARALVHDQSETPNVAFKSRLAWNLGGAIKGETIDKANINITQPFFTFKISGLKGQFKFWPHKNRLAENAIASAGFFTLTAPDAPKTASRIVLQFSNVSSSADNHTVHFKDKEKNPIGSLVYGHRDIVIGNLIFTNPQGEQFTVKDIILKTQQTQKKDTTSIRLDYYIKNIKGSDLLLGPIQFILAMDELDSYSLAQFLEKTLANANASSHNLFRFYKPLLRLIGKGFNIHLQKLHFSTASGPVDFKGYLTIPKQEGIPSVELLLKKTVSTATFTAPRPWLINVVSHFYNHHPKNTGETAPKQLAEKLITHWQNNQLLVNKGNMLELNLHAKNGKLLINGKSPSLKAFFIMDESKKGTTQPSSIKTQTKDSSPQNTQN